MSKAVALHDAMMPEQQIAEAGSVVVVGIEGNSLLLAAGERDASGVFLNHLDHHELDSLAEVVRRVRHPIFMNIDLTQYREPEMLAQRLGQMLQAPEIPPDAPLVVLLPPDRAQLDVRVVAQPDVLPTIGQFLRGQFPNNPYEYPQLFRAQTHPHAEPGKVLLTQVMARLGEVMPLSQMARTLERPFGGVVLAQEGAGWLIPRLLRRRSADSILMTDVGKLRTLYSVVRPGVPAMHFTIPVGLARDDQHYFQTLGLSVEQFLRKMGANSSLFLPPDMTPSPLFAVGANTPQLDCTRLGLQISRYAARCLETTSGNGSSGAAASMLYYITGRASRLPGMRQYIEGRTHMPIRRIDRRPLRGVKLADHIKWGDVADNVQAVGSVLGLLDEPAAGDHLLAGRLHGPPGASRQCPLGELELGRMYVFEHRPQLI